MFTSGGHRYGYNGTHENDNEIAGEGNNLDFGGFGYDPRVGRRWNREPLIHRLPHLSSYVILSNNPTNYFDPDGKYKIDENATPEQKGLIKEAINYIHTLINNKDLQRAMSKYGQIDLKQLKKDILDNDGPVIKVTDLSAMEDSPKGYFHQGVGSDVLAISTPFVNAAIKAKGDLKKDYVFLTAVTILHEHVHYGDDQDGVDYNTSEEDGEGRTGEEGGMFEVQLFGKRLNEMNMRSNRLKFLPGTEGTNANETPKNNFQIPMRLPSEMPVASPADKTRVEKPIITPKK